jgi:hypothetical protein
MCVLRAFPINGFTCHNINTLKSQSSGIQASGHLIQLAEFLREEFVIFVKLLGKESCSVLMVTPPPPPMHMVLLSAISSNIAHFSPTCSCH